ncbi:phage tail protein [Pseudoalteromonas sp. SMN1298-MNA-CIBAN-0114]|uniref:phage tail-collar fiber domain-containing protein n=1 Tax=Pseudoalteromonas sp. SMN1298-MNA-CIBAN-0114 TaxID=3140428 RepID=UPI003329919D
MASVITIAGEKLFAAKAQANEQLDIDTFIFANVPAQDATAPINREEGLPTDHVVHQQIVQQVGRINDNVVVYSTVLDSITGPFEFNWVGLYSSINNTLVAINHIPTTPKTKTEAGVAGNTLNRNFGIEYSGIADLTGINVAPETWQLDFTARLQGMDKLTQQLAKDLNGADSFIDDGFKVVPRSTLNSFEVTPGVGYISGLRVELEEFIYLNIDSYPKYIYADAYFEGDATSTWAPRVICYASDVEINDFIDERGREHYLVLIAIINGQNDVEDLRALFAFKDDIYSRAFNNINAAVEKLNIESTSYLSKMADAQSTIKTNVHNTNNGGAEYYIVFSDSDLTDEKRTYKIGNSKFYLQLHNDYIFDSEAEIPRIAASNQGFLLNDVIDSSISEGTKVIIKDLNNANYMAVDANDIGGFYLIQLANGFKLKLVHTTQIMASQMGFVDDSSTDMYLLLLRIKNYCDQLPKSFFKAPLYTLHFDSTGTGTAVVGGDVVFNGNYNVKMEANFYRTGGKKTGTFIEIGDKSDEQRIFHEFADHKINISTPIKWTGLEDYSGVKINNHVRSKIEFYNVYGFEIGFEVFGYNAGNSYNRYVITKLINNRIHGSLNSYSPIGDSSGYVTSNRFEIIGVITNDSNTENLNLDRYAFVIDGGSYTTEGIQVVGGVIEGLKSSSSVGKDGLVCLIRRGADIVFKGHRDEGNRHNANSPAIINAFNAGGGIKYHPLQMTPPPKSKTTLIQVEGNAAITGCEISCPSLERKNGGVENLNPIIFDSGKLVDNLYITGDKSYQQILKLGRTFSGGGVTKSLDLRPLEDTEPYDSESIKLKESQSNLTFEIDVENINKILIEVDQDELAPVYFYYRLFDESGNEQIATVGVELAGSALSEGNGGFAVPGRMLRDYYIKRNDLVERGIRSRTFLVADNIHKIQLIMVSSGKTPEYPADYSKIKRIRVFKLGGYGCGGGCGISREELPAMGSVPLASEINRLGQTVLNSSPDAQNIGWQFTTNGWISFPGVVNDNP